jgi:hypothetical protein
MGPFSMQVACIRTQPSSSGACRSERRRKKSPISFKLYQLTLCFKREAAAPMELHLFCALVRTTINKLSHRISRTWVAATSKYLLAFARYDFFIFLFVRKRACFALYNVQVHRSQRQPLVRRIFKSCPCLFARSTCLMVSTLASNLPPEGSLAYDSCVWL